MNLKLEVYLFVDEEDFNPEHIANLSVNLSDLVVLLGYGNVAAEEPENTKLKSVVVVRPLKQPKAWQRGDAMAINFPTDDPLFIAQADAGGIPE